MQRTSEDRIKTGGARSGQALLITVLALGGAILGATTVAGLLTLYQIRASTDVANSAKAVFAADAGTQWALFHFYCKDIDVPSRCPGNSAPAVPTFTGPGGSGATLSVTCYSDFGATTPVSCSSTSTLAAISTGISLNSERAFYLGVSTSSPTYP